MGGLDPDSKDNRLPSDEAPESSAKPSSDPFEELFKSAMSPETSTPGEFTNLFGAPPKPEPVAGLGGEESSPATAQPAGRAPSAFEPGPFTKMFAAPKADAEATRVISTPASVASKDLSSSAPTVDFTRERALKGSGTPGAAKPDTLKEDEGQDLAATRLLQHETPAAVQPQPPVAPPAPATPGGAPGAFTALFQPTPASAGSGPLASAPTRPLAAAPPAGPERISFTEMFGLPEKPSPEAPPGLPAESVRLSSPAEAAPPSRSSSFTELFGPRAPSSRAGEQKTVPIKPAPPESGVRPPAAVTPGAPPSPDAFANLGGGPLESAPAGEMKKPAAPAPVASTPPKSVTEPRAETKRPGSFTSMFGPRAEQPAGEAPIASQKPEPAKPAAGSFTQLFGGAAPPPPEAPAKRPTSAATDDELARMFNFPLRDSAPGAQPATPAKPSSGEFTKLFGGVPGSTAPSSPPATSQPPGAFTQLFGGSGPVTPSSGGAAAKESGAFTKLFGTPGAAGTPEPARPQETGAFSKLFGGPATPVSRQPGAFTKVFGGETQPPMGKSPAVTREFGAGTAPPSPAARPPEAPPSLQEKQQFGGGLFAPSAVAPTAGQPSSGATEIFSRPGGAGQAPPPPAPAGPSAFTQIISGGMVRQAQQQAQPPAPAPPAQPPATQFPFPGVTPPQVAMPQVTPGQVSMPGMTPPAVGMPQMTPGSMAMPGVTPPQVQMPYMMPPQMQMPAMQFPPMAAPPVPQPPPAAAPGAAGGKVNWIPVIIGANVLFIIIVIIVLIFALKR